MTILNTGTVYASGPLDSEALAFITSVFGEFDEQLNARADKMEFEDYPSGTLDIKLDELVDRLGERGIQLEGRVDFTGDMDGAYLLRQGEHCVELTQNEVAIMDATDEELASELRRRGYDLELFHNPSMTMEL